MDKTIISFEAPESTKELLRAQAFHRSMSVSALIREIIETSLASKNTEVNQDESGS